jgi:ABC-2 type transport system ATP-binding protein
MLAQQPIILVKTEKLSDLQKVLEIAKADGHHATIRSEVAYIEGPEEWAGTLNRKAFEAGVIITQLAPQLPNLEETFFEMTGDRS